MDYTLRLLHQCNDVTAWSTCDWNDVKALTLMDYALTLLCRCHVVTTLSTPYCNDVIVDVNFLMTLIDFTLHCYIGAMMLL